MKLRSFERQELLPELDWRAILDEHASHLARARSEDLTISLKVRIASISISVSPAFTDEPISTYGRASGSGRT
jgi:hypothetical protein